MEQYQLKEACSQEELNALVDVIWIAQYDPYRVMFQAFFPVLGPSAEDRTNAIEESKERLWAAHHKSRTSHWFYVTETSTCSIVGAAHWQIEDASTPISGITEYEATWWPPGKAREFANEIVRQLYAPRHEFMLGPSIGGSISPSSNVRRETDPVEWHICSPCCQVIVEEV